MLKTKMTIADTLKTPFVVTRDELGDVIAVVSPNDLQVGTRSRPANLHVSGVMTVGSGTVKITSGDIQLGQFTKIMLTDDNQLMFFDSANPSGITLSSGGGGGVPTTRQVIAGAGLDGGGALSSDVTLNLDTITGVAGNYGNANSALIVTVDNYGRLTAISTVPSSAGDVSGPSSSVDSELALFSGTTGKLIKSAAGDGIAKLTAGVLSLVSVGTTSSDLAAGNAPVAAVTTHVALADPHTQYALESALGGAAALNVGTTAGTVAAGDDSRFTDSRTPTGSAGGDLSGTYPNPSVAKIGGVAVTVDTDGTLTTNSDAKLATQKATKTYADTKTTGVASSVDSEVALFSGTTGKLLKRAASTGIAYLTAGVLSTLTTSGILDLIDTTRGIMLYRGAGGWAALIPGTAGQALRTAGSGSDPVWSDINNCFGSGIDGALDFDGASTITLWDGTTVVPVGSVYTLPQDIEATTLRIRSGVRVDTGGFVIYANGLVTFDDATAFISRNGGNASGITGGTGVSGGSLGSTSTGGAAGRSTTGAGTSPGGVTQALGNRGGGGGAGGGQGGGVSGTRAIPSAANGSWRSLGFLLRGLRLHNGATWQTANGGGGGGSGGCNVGTGTASSGAGGAGGGVLVAFLRYITGPGIIESNGGTGGNASATGNGAAGGGGGGGGGYAALITSSLSSTVTVRSLGGTFGTGAGGGNNGNAGNAGNTITITM